MPLNKYTFGASVAATLFLFLFIDFSPLGFLGANLHTVLRLYHRIYESILLLLGPTHWLFHFVIIIVEITPVAFAMIRWNIMLCMR